MKFWLLVLKPSFTFTILILPFINHIQFYITAIILILVIQTTLAFFELA